MATAYKPVERNFVNFDDYLAQNDPSGLVKSATGDLGKKAGKLQSDIQAGQTGFLDKAIAGSGGFVSKGTDQPYNLTLNNPEDTAGVKRAANASYTGPRTLAESMGRDVTNEVGDVNSRIKGLGSAAGRMTLLQEQQKNQPGYTRGMSAYDAALLGGSQQGQKAIGGLQEQYGDLAGFLGKAQKQTGETAAEVEGMVQGLKGSAQNYLTAMQNKPPPPAVDPASQEARQARTDTANTELRKDYAINQTPGDERIQNVGDEQAASRYGDKILNEWIAAGRPEFSGWIRTKKKK